MFTLYVSSTCALALDFYIAIKDEIAVNGRALVGARSCQNIVGLLPKI